MTNKLRIHQQNLRKSSTATQDLLSNLEHSNTDLILIQEPHTNSNNKIMGFPSSSSMYQANSEIIPKTAHGPFAEYFCRMKISNNPFCSCDNSSIQNPSHLLLNCSHYEPIKESLSLNHITNLNSFVQTKENFKKFKKLCQHIHDHLRSIEASNNCSISNHHPLSTSITTHPQPPNC
ncbi:hypothetical protein SSS_02088 [Sarcoptes scabiei]|uniref:Endonuclease/exonuclease/phosphatase domain-containing protein n=1 Tax=Sarcoptes scabiei TaxID=52283 RepID=A0A834R201_SARSC|nr:hypothetical protein SSS_02088 [Sarcoptes scabiei]